VISLSHQGRVEVMVRMLFLAESRRTLISNAMRQVLLVSAILPATIALRR
jgi:hypothetical protein